MQSGQLGYRNSNLRGESAKDAFELAAVTGTMRFDAELNPTFERAVTTTTSAKLILEEAISTTTEVAFTL